VDHPERLAGALQYLELQLAVYEQQHLQQKDVESRSSSQFNMCCNTSTVDISFKNFYRLRRYSLELHDQLCFALQDYMALPTMLQQCFSYKPYFFCQPTVFFSHDKSANSIFSHGFSDQARTDCSASRLIRCPKVYPIHMRKVN